MPDTLAGLLVILIAVLPGGVHTWAFERVTGKSEHKLSDRLPRLVAASAVYLVLSLPAVSIFSGIARSAAAGTTTAVWHYAAALGLLVLLPLTIGSLLGALTNRRHRKGLIGWMGQRVGGAGYAPRAWDHLFGADALQGTIRVTLVDGTQILGVWARRVGLEDAGDPPATSYASGYPTEQRDIYISQLIKIEYPQGVSQEATGTAWIPAESVRFIEFYPNRSDASERTSTG